MLISTPEELANNLDNVKDDFDIDLIKPAIRRTERKHIIPVISKALYDRINDKYEADPATLTDIEQELLDEIQSALANL
ncbi:hypothetical protein V6R21_17650, partial [Limibacter armeniacum]